MPRRPIRRQGRVRLGVLALALGGFVFISGCDASEDSDLDRGRALFLQNCGTCHTLAQAGSSADVGPDLDASFAQARTDGMDTDTVEGVVQQQIANPRTVEEGVPNYSDIYMPAELVTGQDAEDVAAYVASVAGILARSRRSCRPISCSPSGAGAVTPSRRPAPGPPARSRRRPGRQGRKLHRAADRRSELADRAGIRAGRDAAGLRTSLTPQDIKGLVDYLMQNVGGGGGGG